MMDTNVLIIVLLVLVLLLVAVMLWKLVGNSQHKSALELQRQQLEEVNRRQMEMLNNQHAQQLDALTQKYERQNENLRREMSLQFKVLASEILEKSSSALKYTNSEQLDALLRPLKENIDSFRAAVNDSYVKENSSRVSLANQIEKLMKLNESIGQEARNLTTALKGNSKVQGDWGEMVLETLLENAGLERGINFEVQVTRDSAGAVLRDESGRAIRPDVIIKLPDNHSIIVDSKVSLSAFVDYSTAETEESRALHGKRHLQSVYRHIDELHAKMYQDAVRGSAEYVMMFIPNESAYVAAVQLDLNLWKYAYDRGVMIVSPTHLFSVMSIVTQLWRQDKQNKNAQLIAEKGGKLYDKLVLFIESFERVGKLLDDAQSAYQKSVGQLRSGRGNVLRQTEELKSLGAKASKSLPDKLIDMAD